MSAGSAVIPVLCQGEKPPLRCRECQKVALPCHMQKP